jgi:hypothetical protein
VIVGWINLETDFSDWADAPEPEDLKLYAEVAHEKLLEWAPSPIPTGSLVDPLDGVTILDPIPARYKYAQKLLTQHLYARKRAGDGEGFGADGFMISTYPLVREAYEAVRPKRSPLFGLR